MKVSLGVLKEYLAFVLENETLLIEGRVDDAREKFPDMEEDVFDNLVANQPGGSNNKYLMWSCKQVDDGTMPEEVIMVIRLFHDNVQRLQQKDINQYESVDALNTAIDALAEKIKKKERPKEGEKPRPNEEIIYEDERWLVVRPHTTETSQTQGSQTNWCIAARGGSNYFNHYSTNNNKFYFVIDKPNVNWDPSRRQGNRNGKFAIAIIATGLAAAGREIQIYDSNDALVPLSKVADTVGDKWPEIWKKIQDHVAANPKTREVEEAEKATEEHVKALLRGDRLGDIAMKKVAQNGPMSTAVLRGILRQYQDYSGPTDYRDPRQDVMNTLSGRAAEMESKGAVLVLKWIAGSRPAESTYWSGAHYLERMLQHANLGPEQFRELAQGGDEALLANIYANNNAPEDVKTAIAAQVMTFRTEEAQRKVYWELIKSGKINREQMEHAMATGRRGYNYLASQILQRASEVQLPADLIRLIPVTSTHDFKQLLQMPNIPGDYAAQVLTGLMRGGNIEKYDLYQMLKTVPLGADNIEKMWADNTKTDVRAAMLQNPAIGVGNASKFAKSKNSAYRFAIAHNTVTPPDDLVTLAKDESVSTRAAVAANPSTPAETLTALAKDEAIAVRASIASNSSTPRTVLIALKKDSDDFVRKAVRKTLKTLGVAESMMRFMMSMRNLITEEMKDDDTPDIMNPSWRELPQRSIAPEEFVAVFLLQNNGSATREEIQNAYQDWTGQAGHQELWKKPWSQEKILRGITAGGKGWYWSPPGINKGALFRLTPAGASAAVDVLDRNRNAGTGQRSEVNSSTARPGKTYYTKQTQEVLDITGYERGTLTVEEVEASRQTNQPIKRDGKYSKLSPNRSRYTRRHTHSARIFKYTAPDGEVKYIESLPKVTLPGNSEVQFLKSMYGIGGQEHHRREANQAIVRKGERFYVIQFPLWIKERGEIAREREPNEAPPVRKSPPPRELTGEPAPARAPGAPRATGPKVSYKIYGKKAGKPAHTRLKGQAYGAPADTQFSNGEQAVLQATDDGKLKVKKVDGDHEQTWDPVEG